MFELGGKPVVLLLLLLVAEAQLVHTRWPGVQGESFRRALQLADDLTYRHIGLS